MSTNTVASDALKRLHCLDIHSKFRYEDKDLVFMLVGLSHDYEAAEIISQNGVHHCVDANDLVIPVADW